MAHDCIATWKSVSKGDHEVPRFCPDAPEFAAAPNSMAKRGIWEISGLGASSLSRIWHVWRGGGPGARASSLKLISNETQPLGSHPSEKEEACDIPGAAPGRSSKNQSRPGAVCPSAPCLKGLPGGTDSGLVWAKPSCQA